eukprot:1334330-Amorphochlora_amoeboformis.AAC.1
MRRGVGARPRVAEQGGEDALRIVTEVVGVKFVRNSFLGARPSHTPSQSDSRLLQQIDMDIKAALWEGGISFWLIGSYAPHILTKEFSK